MIAVYVDPITVRGYHVIARLSSLSSQGLAIDPPDGSRDAGSDAPCLSKAHERGSVTLNRPLVLLQTGQPIMEGFSTEPFHSIIKRGTGSGKQIK